MKPQHAFTLIEALTVLVIISILGMMAIPGLQTMLQRSQDNALRDDLLRLIDFAHDRAMFHHKTITMCMSNDSHNCRGEWSDGLIVFIDPRRQGRVLQEDQILAVKKIMPRRGTLHARFFPFYRESIRFNPVLIVANDNGTFWYCRFQSAHPSWAIKINRMGIRHVLLPDMNGEIKDHAGKALIC